MTMDVQMVPGTEYLTAVFTGAFALEDAKRIFRETLVAAGGAKASRVLVDARAVTGAPSDADRDTYASYAAQAVATARREQPGWDPRFAYVMHAPLRDPGRFGENVAVNRGMDVQTFEGLEAAVLWLTQARA